jgi:2-haloalkanoic acid dehalogenase type II
MKQDFSKYSVLTFDCYGTLIDWERGIWDAFQPVLTQNNRMDITKDLALKEFASLESDQQSATPGKPYSNVLKSVHAGFALGNQLATTDEMDEKFAKSIAEWPSFPDSADALRSLQTKFKLAILSNVDRAGFATSNQKLGVEFDAIYTAEDIGSYKPDLRNFEHMLRHLSEDLGFEKSDVLHVAQSLHHDHAPARKMGLRNVWIDRQNISRGGTDWKESNWGATALVDEVPETDFVFFTMEEFARAAVG